ncbi:hypothetical protein ACH4D3_08535 [Streptomyces sp. NPDC018026]|uniref:hypothetical protein n=1 Tax=Streptomyces sp. NPDC018026 TaxID=3365031 RepID=UPI003791B9B7
MTIDAHAAPALTRPTVAEVFVHAAARIHQAAAGIWPGEPVLLDAHVPSVTGYVHRARVGDRVLYGKTSILGVSLVSLLRGTRGSWPTVLQAQQEYEQRPDGLLVREAAQLRILSDPSGPQVCPVAGMRDGVIFTEAVPGPTLTDLLLVMPERTRELMEQPLAELRPLHRPGAARRLDPAGAIGERSIAGTFQRKFNEGADTYVDDLGAEHCDPETRAAIVELVRASVSRLRRLRMTLPAPVGTSLAFGDLKPEHVVFPAGPDCRPVLLDPGLLRGSPMVDLAKLLSRTVLVLITHRPGPAITRQILAGLALLALTRAGHLSARERRPWLRHLLTLWLIDTLNITTTYLSAPAALPLPRLGAAVVDRALALCLLVDAVSADLLDGGPGMGDRSLGRIAEVAA